jgi:hypothetical protein
MRTPFATLVLNLNLIDSRDAEMRSLIKSHRTRAEPLKYRLSATGKEQECFTHIPKIRETGKPKHNLYF